MLDVVVQVGSEHGLYRLQMLCIVRAENQLVVVLIKQGGGHSVGEIGSVHKAGSCLHVTHHANDVINVPKAIEAVGGAWGEGGGFIVYS
jgi:hypothetical protein